MGLFMTEPDSGNPQPRTEAQFLHTVVVVDDQAYAGIGVEPPATLGAGSLDDVLREDDTAALRENDAFVPDSQDFDTETVVEGFAELGMVCAALSPDSDGELDIDRFLKVARRADAVILDWIIRPPGAQSQNSLEFLVALIDEDAGRGGRLRLICIYTGDAAPDGIVDRVAEGLSTHAPEVTKEPGKLWVTIPGTRIVVLSKPRDPEVSGAVVVPAADLPGRVKIEFDSLVGDAILPQIALSSLAIVRDSAHRLLQRFHRDLDPALLAHRATTTPVATEQFSLSLIGDELRALVTARGAVPQLSDEEVDRMIDSCLADGGQRFIWTASGASARTLNNDDARKALTLGLDGNNSIRDSLAKKLTEKTSLTSLLILGDEVSVRRSAMNIDLRFSALSSLSRDSAHEGPLSTRPELRLGAIVSRSVMRKPKVTAGTGGAASGGKDAIQPNSAATGKLDEDPKKVQVREFWLCLQPICDSVRLNTATRFPFLPLLPVDMPSDAFDLVIADGEYQALKIEKLKFNRVKFFEFLPDLATSSVRADWTSGAWQFSGLKGRRFKWHGNVRVDKAHALIGRVVNDAGRVGTSEYEYLRRVSK